MENAFNVLINEFDSKDIYYAFGAGKGENVKQIQLFFLRLHQHRVQKKIIITKIIILKLQII